MVLNTVLIICCLLELVYHTIFNLVLAKEIVNLNGKEVLNTKTIGYRIGMVTALGLVICLVLGLVAIIDYWGDAREAQRIAAVNFFIFINVANYMLLWWAFNEIPKLRREYFMKTAFWIIMLIVNACADYYHIF